MKGKWQKDKREQKRRLWSWRMDNEEYRLDREVKESWRNDKRRCWKRKQERHKRQWRRTT